MELKEISDALDRIEGKMKDTSEANKAELKRLGDEQVKLSRQLIEVQPSRLWLPRLKRSLSAPRLLSPMR